MKSTDKIKEYRGMKEGELKSVLESSERELLNLRFRHAAGQLEQSAQLTSLRRQIARVRTALVEKTTEQKNA